MVLGAWLVVLTKDHHSATSAYILHLHSTMHCGLYCSWKSTTHLRHTTSCTCTLLFDSSLKSIAQQHHGTYASCRVLLTVIPKSTIQLHILYMLCFVWCVFGVEHGVNWAALWMVCMHSGIWRKWSVSGLIVYLKQLRQCTSTLVYILQSWYEASTCKSWCRCMH